MDDHAQLDGVWRIDGAHSRIGFATRHAMVTKVRGAFNHVSGVAVIDTNDLAASRVKVVLRTASIDTRNSDRDAHLRSPDFFDAQTYPEITFDSTSLDEVGDGSYIVNGQLTIRDITRTVSIPLSLVGVERDHSGSLRAGFEGTRRIDRKAWGVEWNTPLDSGGVLVSDKITLEFELSLVKDQPNVDEAQ